MDKDLLSFLTYGRSIGASDVILKEEDCISYRVNGKVQRLKKIISKEEMDLIYLNMKPEGLIYEYSYPITNYDIAFDYEGRYRVNLFSSNQKKCAVFRIINCEIKSLSDINLPQNISIRVKNERGLSLVVGKTGAGKSTTLAAIIKDILQTEKCHIITLEDPIEYVFENNLGLITQRELGKDFLSFEEGIFQSLRQSPDYIMIGEIRNSSSLRAAIMAAEAGHGIIATMHSLGGEKTITKMLSMFPESEKDFFRYEIATNLNFILSQKLYYGENKVNLDYEFLTNTKSISNTIREGRLNQINNIIMLSEKDDMKSFDLEN